MSAMENEDQALGPSSQRDKGVYSSAALMPSSAILLPILRTSRETAEAEDSPHPLFLTFVSVEQRPFACEVGFVGLFDVSFTRQLLRESFKGCLVRTVSVA